MRGQYYVAKRGFAFLLAFVLLFSGLNLPVRAAEDNTDSVPDGLEIVEDSLKMMDAEPVDENKWMLGTNGKIECVYDEASKTLTVSGNDELCGDWDDSDNEISPFDEICKKNEVEKICFTQCTLSDSMWNIFLNLPNLKVIDFSGIDTSNVEDMSGMFSGCSGLTNLDLSKFATGNVTDMSEMFFGCSGLTSLDVSSFDTSKVRDMVYMFYGCSGLTSLDLRKFKTEKVESMSAMFCGCSGLTSIDLSKFNTEKVESMSTMFYGCSGLTSLDVSKFKTEKVESMSAMFGGCSGLTSLDVSKFNTENVEYMSSMFSGCTGLTSLDLSNFDTSKVTRMSWMFGPSDIPGLGCNSLTELDLSNFDTSNVTDMEYMFFLCCNLKSVDVSSFDTSKVESMEGMFYACNALEHVDVSKFNTSNVTDMREMFRACGSLTGINVKSFDTRKVKNMERMFLNCHSLPELDLSSFDIGSDVWAGGMFEIYTPPVIYAPRTIATEIDLGGTYLDSDAAEYQKLSAANAGKKLTKKEAAPTPTPDLTPTPAPDTTPTPVPAAVYTITYQLDGGTNAAANPAAYDVTTDTITLAAPVRSGYIFAGWYADAAFTVEVKEIAKGSTGDKVFYAKWKKPGKYAIVYQMNGGTNAAGNPDCYDETTTPVTLADPAREGYDFAGWYSDTTYKNRVAELKNTDTGNLILRAKWTAHQYTINFDGSGGSGSMKAMTNRAYGTAYELSANKFKKDGAVFIGWGSSAGGTEVAYRDCDCVKDLTAESGGSVTLYAVWLDLAANSAYSITYRLDGGTNDPANPSYYTEGSAVTLKAPTKQGYSFDGWYAKSNLKGGKTESIDAGSKGNKTLYAKWTPLTYTIKFNGNPMGITQGNSKATSGAGGKVENSMADITNVKTGKKVTLKANKFKYNGYTFAGWNTKPDGSGVAVKNKAGVKDLCLGEDGAFNDTVTLYAQWTETKYAITYKLNKGKLPKADDTTAPGAPSCPKSYTIGSDTITLAAPTRSGYTFDGWYTTKKCKEGTKVDTIPAGSAKKITLYAKWVKNK